MQGTSWVRIGAILGALAVILGAFLAHGLKPKADDSAQLSSTQRTDLEHRLEVFDIGAKYQMYHSLAIVALGAVAMTSGGASSRRLNAAGWLFLIGILIFSGTLYGIGFGGPKWLGMITPFGGLAMIAGWVALATVAIPHSQTPVAENPPIR